MVEDLVGMVCKIMEKLMSSFPDNYGFRIILTVRNFEKNWLPGLFYFLTLLLEIGSDY